MNRSEAETRAVSETPLTKKNNFYLRFAGWTDGALWRQALVCLILSAAVATVFFALFRRVL